MLVHRSVSVLGALALIVGISGAAQAGATLDGVQARGVLACGVNTGVAGFSQPDSQGTWRGLDTDICRAIAAAVLGDATKVRFVPLSGQRKRRGGGTLRRGVVV